MLVEEGDFRARLGGVIQSLDCRAELKEDLQQEVIIHLWQLEQRRPRQTRSWYLQAGKYFALHAVRVGRSIDSARRAAQRVELPDDADLADEILNPPETRNGLFFSDVSAREVEEALVSRLTPIDERILAHLRDGHSVRETARKLGLSHPSVLNRRKKIARLARRLGLAGTGFPTTPRPPRSNPGTRPASRAPRVLPGTECAQPGG